MSTLNVFSKKTNKQTKNGTGFTLPKCLEGNGSSVVINIYSMAYCTDTDTDAILSPQVSSKTSLAGSSE